MGIRREIREKGGYHRGSWEAASVRSCPVSGVAQDRTGCALEHLGSRKAVAPPLSPLPSCRPSVCQTVCHRALRSDGRLCWCLSRFHPATSSKPSHSARSLRLRLFILVITEGASAVGYRLVSANTHRRFPVRGTIAVPYGSAAIRPLFPFINYH